MLQLTHSIDDDSNFNKLVKLIIGKWYIFDVTKYNLNTNILSHIYLRCPLQYVPLYQQNYQFLLLWVKYNNHADKQQIVINGNQTYNFTATFSSVNKDELMSLTSEIIEHNDGQTTNFEHGTSCVWYPLPCNSDNDDGNNKKYFHEEVSWKYGNKHDPHKCWRPTDKLEEECNYEQGKLHGTITTYHTSMEVEMRQDNIPLVTKLEHDYRTMSLVTLKP